jgi:hypothetical protein
MKNAVRGKSTYYSSAETHNFVTLIMKLRDLYAFFTSTLLFETTHFVLYGRTDNEVLIYYAFQRNSVSMIINRLIGAPSWKFMNLIFL